MLTLAKIVVGIFGFALFFCGYVFILGGMYGARQDPWSFFGYALGLGCLMTLMVAVTWWIVGGK